MLTRLVLHRHRDVLQTREAHEQSYVLERADHAAPRHVVGGEAEKVEAVESHRAAVRLDVPGEQIEHRRLASSVGTHESGDGSFVQIEVEVLRGNDAAEVLRQVAHLQHELTASPHLFVRDLVLVRRFVIAIVDTLEGDHLRDHVLHHLDADIVVAGSPQPAPK